MADEDDGIWDYKPVKRGKRSENTKRCKSSIIAQSKHSETGRLLMSMSKIRKDGKGEDITNTKIGPKIYNGCHTSSIQDETEEFCPFCQMPFSILRVQSPRWHVMECMDLPLKATEG